MALFEGCVALLNGGSRPHIEEPSFGPRGSGGSSIWAHNTTQWLPARRATRNGIKMWRKVMRRGAKVLRSRPRWWQIVAQQRLAPMCAPAVWSARGRRVIGCKMAAASGRLAPTAASRVEAAFSKLTSAQQVVALAVKAICALAGRSAPEASGGRSGGRNQNMNSDCVEPAQFPDSIWPAGGGRASVCALRLDAGWAKSRRTSEQSGDCWPAGPAP